MKDYTYIIVDIGCIECGESSIVRYVTTSKSSATVKFKKICEELKIEKWEPAGGFLEIFRKRNTDVDTTYVYGIGYFTGGQHSLELHRVIRRGK